jgi:predicted O-methyltransferase YrrM
MSFFSKSQTIIWFIKRPALYPQLGYLFRQKFFPHKKENTRKEATTWCMEQSVTTQEAVSRLTRYKTVNGADEFLQTLLTDAKMRVESVPLKMGGGADLQLLYILSEYLSATRIIETGVAYGWSSTALLASLMNRPGSKLYSTDMPYPKMNNEEFVGCAVPEAFKSNWTLIRLPDRAGLRRIEATVDSIDLCHYDSDKSYRGRMWAYPRLWNLLRVGGIFISDDIQDNVAFKDFASMKREEPLVVYYPGENKYIGILTKQNES